MHEDYKYQVKKKKMISLLKNKKAISPIIATTLIILMTIAAVAIIWPAVMPIIKRSAAGISSACIGIDLTIVSSGKNTCFNSTSCMINVTVSRGAGDYELKGIQFLIYEGGNSESYTIETNMPGINEQREYEIPTAFSSDKISAAPIVIVGEVEENCEKTTTTSLNECV